MSTACGHIHRLASSSPTVFCVNKCCIVCRAAAADVPVRQAVRCPAAGGAAGLAAADHPPSPGPQRPVTGALSSAVTQHHFFRSIVPLPFTTSRSGSGGARSGTVRQLQAVSAQILHQSQLRGLPRPAALLYCIEPLHCWGRKRMDTCLYTGLNTGCSRTNGPDLGYPAQLQRLA